MALQSPIGISSSYRPEASVTVRQPPPIYTTAGTIYNPNSSQPLQPPTRRGRSLKWSSGLPPELALLPKSMLSALPLHSHGSTRPVPPMQYSPLQQNYDRAVSPSIESSQPPIDGVTAQTPRLFAINMHNESVSDQKEIMPEQSEDDDKEDELRLKPLLNMPVKSLHNLASYPNPNQKIAQKVILRGVRSNLASTTVPGLDGCGPNSTAVQEDFFKGRRESTPYAAPIALKPVDVGPSDGPGGRSKQDFQFVNHGQMRASLYRSNTDNGVHEEQPAYTTLAAGPGAPRPLTAGPPGQRQYRPSTFDTTFKALRAKEMSFGTPEGASSPPFEHESISNNMFETHSKSRDQLTALLGDSTPFDLKDDFGTDTSSWVHLDENPVWDCVPDQTFLEDQILGRAGFVNDRTSSPLTREHCVLGQLESKIHADVPITAEERLQTRLLNVASAWQSGQFTGIASGFQAGTITSSWGVIGDKSLPKPYPNGVREARLLPMDEANKLTAAEHSKPLLELVLASLERNLSWSHFSTPDPSLVDDTPEGNKSLFEKP